MKTSAQSSCNGHKNSAQCISLMAFFFFSSNWSMQVQFQQQKENMLHALYRFNRTLSTCLNFGCSFFSICLGVCACIFITHFIIIIYFVAGYTWHRIFTCKCVCICIKCICSDLTCIHHHSNLAISIFFVVTHVISILLDSTLVYSFSFIFLYSFSLSSTMYYFAQNAYLFIARCMVLFSLFPSLSLSLLNKNGNN